MENKSSIASLIPASQDLYRKIVFEIADGIIGIDEAGIIRLCNPAAEALFGWKTGELLEKPLEVLLPQRMHASHQSLVHGFRAGSRDARYMGQREAGIVGKRADGSEIHLAITILRTSAANAPMLVAVIRDVSLNVRHQQDLKRLADTDPLSGLLNRRAFRQKALDRLSVTTGGPSSLLLFDLDDFKGVNDRFGHDAGDEAILRFAEILQAGSRSQDLAGRWGGEEFVLFLPDTSEPVAMDIAEAVRSSFALSYFLWPRFGAIRLTASAGLASGRVEGSGLDALVCCADDALYLAKRSGRDRVVSCHLAEEAAAS